MQWCKIEDMPPEMKDGRTVRLRQAGWAPVHARWANGWAFIEYGHPAPHCITHYATA